MGRPPHWESHPCHFVRRLTFTTDMPISSAMLVNLDVVSRVTHIIDVIRLCGFRLRLSPVLVVSATSETTIFYPKCIPGPDSVPFFLIQISTGNSIRHEIVLYFSCWFQSYYLFYCSSYFLQLFLLFCPLFSTSLFSFIFLYTSFFLLLPLLFSSPFSDLLLLLLLRLNLFWNGTSV